MKRALQRLDAAIAGYRLGEDSGHFRLRRIATDDHAGAIDKEHGQALAEAEIGRLDALQEKLYAEGRRSLLVVFQALDTGGKDGVIRRVFGAIDALGCLETSFKAPNSDDLAHGYLWRIQRAVPPKGVIGIFNRSHYEDVLVVRVRGLAAPADIERRYAQINDFERYLAETGTTVVKFFLHISKEEQRQRLQARLDQPDKRWKFNVGDLEDRARWAAYMEAYQIALRRCSTAAAPWYVVPSDRKWYRDLVVARVVRQTLEAMKPRYPQPKGELPKHIP